MKKSDILKELKWRGIVNNITDEKKIEELLNSQEDIGVYCGFDPSFRSLHLGNYVMMRILKLFKQYQIKTVALVGGATGMIGDPSGKSQERNLLAADVVTANIAGISAQLKKYTNADLIFNNADIWCHMNVVEFLRDVGKNFNVNTMLEKDIIKSRLEVGISYSEFTYSILQSYDWLQLYKQHHVCIQCGGSDQWGNITAGTELFRKIYGPEHQAVGLTINLLLKEDGKKFGKSEKGAIYFDPTITSPYEMYQFLINQNDQDLEKLFKFFSDFNEQEIIDILTQHQANPKLRYGQQMLAKTIVSDVHGESEFQQCQKISEIMFREQYQELPLPELDRILSSYDVIDVSLQNETIIEFLKNHHIVDSNREIRTLIEQKGLKVNGTLVTSENLIIDHTILLHGKYLLIKKGKKHFFVIRAQN